MFTHRNSISYTLSFLRYPPHNPRIRGGGLEFLESVSHTRSLKSIVNPFLRKSEFFVNLYDAGFKSDIPKILVSTYIVGQA